jgi:hypothetical protein
MARARIPTTSNAGRNKKAVNFGSANEVVFRQAADGMGRIADKALLVADLEIGVVIFAMGNPSRGIDESQGLEVILEQVGFNQRVTPLFPPAQILQQALDFFLFQRWNPAFAGLAVFFRKITQRGIHVRSPIKVFASFHKQESRLIQSGHDRSPNSKIWGQQFSLLDPADLF